jgi:flavin reductase (DIM6/NTAB) family NADH-FMN oxidoreductase RutF
VTLREMRTVEASAAVTGSSLRHALQTLGAGVVIVTAPGPDGPAGVTVTSFTPLSLEPPLVSFALGWSSSTLPAFRLSGCFAAHVLGADQRSLAERFAGPRDERFASPTDWEEGPRGLPLLRGALARLICARREVLPFGDHHLIVGKVVAVTRTEHRPALVHHRGAMRGL